MSAVTSNVISTSMLRPSAAAAATTQNTRFLRKYFSWCILHVPGFQILTTNLQYTLNTWQELKSTDALVYLNWFQYISTLVQCNEFPLVFSMH